MDEELGDEVGDVDWSALDPRKYDPRRIVRDALLEDDPIRPVSTPATRPVTGAGAARAATGARRPRAASPPRPTPYDDEAT